VSAADEGEIDRSLSSYPPDVCVVDLGHSRLSPERIRRHLRRAHNLQ
jgi:hypothetical protein